MTTIAKCAKCDSILPSSGQCSLCTHKNPSLRKPDQPKRAEVRSMPSDRLIRSEMERLGLVLQPGESTRQLADRARKMVFDKGWELND